MRKSNELIHSLKPGAVILARPLPFSRRGKEPGAAGTVILGHKMQLLFFQGGKIEVVVAVNGEVKCEITSSSLPPSPFST